MERYPARSTPPKDEGGGAISVFQGKIKAPVGGSIPAKPAATVNRPFVFNYKCLIMTVLQKKV
jgi:hypothetical protein